MRGVEAGEKMKYTLKNRPHSEDYFTIYDLRAEIEPWFEGFEKELRESIDFFETKYHPRLPHQEGFKEGFVAKMMEILGE